MIDKHLLVDIAEDLHVRQGASTAQIAELLGRKKNTVLQGLRYRGKLRPSLGKDVEEQVAKWLESVGFDVECQRGDAPYDLLVAGQRIDVKSAHKSKDRQYHFSLQTSNMPNVKDLQRSVDWFYLVFLDESGKPIFRIHSHNIDSVYGIGFTNPFLTRRPLELIGLLEGMPVDDPIGLF